MPKKSKIPLDKMKEINYSVYNRVLYSRNYSKIIAPMKGKNGKTTTNNNNVD